MCILALLTLKANFQEVTDGQVVTVTENQNLEIECSTDRNLVDVTLSTIPAAIESLLVTGASASAQNFTLPDVNRTFNGTVFECADNTDRLSFSIEIECKGCCQIQSYIDLPFI